MSEEEKFLITADDKKKLSRREFIQRAAVLTGNLAAATTLMDTALSPAAP